MHLGIHETNGNNNNGSTKNNYRYSNVFIEPNHQAIMHLLAKNIKTKYKIKTNT